VVFSEAIPIGFQVESALKPEWNMIRLIA